MKLFYICPRCGLEHQLYVTPLVPARTYGPPELCYPEEGGEFEPECCENCGAEFEPGVIWDRVRDQEAAMEERRAEDENQRRIDERNGGL